MISMGIEPYSSPDTNQYPEPSIGGEIDDTIPSLDRESATPAKITAAYLGGAKGTLVSLPRVSNIMQAPSSVDLPLQEIHEIARGRLKDWKEEEHEADNLLLQLIKREG